MIEVGGVQQRVWGKSSSMCMGSSGSGEMAQRMKYLYECEDIGIPCNASLGRSLGQTG